MLILKQKILSEKGFTLVEVLITIAVLGILSISVLSIFTVNKKRQFQTVNQTTAVLLAQEGIEQIYSDK